MSGKHGGGGGTEAQNKVSFLKVSFLNCKCLRLWLEQREEGRQMGGGGEPERPPGSSCTPCS